MKKILLILSSLLMLIVATSCEKDPADLLDGTQWKSELYIEGWYRYITFGDDTFEAEQTVYDEDKNVFLDKREYLGGGTYICNEFSVIMMIDGVVMHEGIVASDQIVFNRQGDAEVFIKQ